MKHIIILREKSNSHFQGREGGMSAAAKKRAKAPLMLVLKAVDRSG